MEIGNKECEGCRLSLSLCWIRTNFNIVINYKPNYEICPCTSCIVKIPCSRGCGILSQYCLTLQTSRRKFERGLEVIHVR